MSRVINNFRSDLAGPKQQIRQGVSYFIFAKARFLRDFPLRAGTLPDCFPYSLNRRKFVQHSWVIR